MIFLLAAAMLLSLACAAFCAGAETGFFSVNRGRVLHLAREGGKAAKTLQKALSDMQSTLTALLVGNNLAAVSFSSASAALASRLFPGGGAAASAWTLFAAFAIGAAYLASPIDIVPDVIPFAGWIDDIMILTAVVRLARFDLERYRRWKTETGRIS